MLTFKELIINTDFAKVWEKFIIHYPDFKDKKVNFNSFYKKLKFTPPSANRTNMYIYINVYQEDTDGQTIWTQKFTEDDDSLHFDVCGMDDEWTGYSLAASKFHEWLGYYIDEESLNTMTNDSFVAHCLYEMTFYYGDDDTKSLE
ncbi:DUF6557 family protein [Marininema halotolerans]|uniref:Uncharacterized protein n=1 Tax=Marininema halotolerans TaxID=1155944 RepID=A0A1I6UBK8_9BACL|nr:DUF6557 family protein [Marininema halotolerans]SFS98677.1 hypothetical protein SAMN05444972_11515 [Marininema halotolerans]